MSNNIYVVVSAHTGFDEIKFRPKKLTLPVLLLFNVYIWIAASFQFLASLPLFFWRVRMFFVLRCFCFCPLITPQSCFYTSFSGASRPNFSYKFRSSKSLAWRFWTRQFSPISWSWGYKIVKSRSGCRRKGWRLSVCIFLRSLSCRSWLPCFLLVPVGIFLPKY